MKLLLDFVFFLTDGILRSVKYLPRLIESRKFWVISFYFVFYLLTTLSVYVSVFREAGYDHSKLLSLVIQVSISGIVAGYGMWAFYYAIQREYMLWIGFVMFTMPISIFSLTYNAYGKYSAGYMITIPSIFILWLIGRWYYDTIPE
jgi:hypothetical protein